MNASELVGRYRSRAVDSALGETGTGSEQVAIAFEIIEDGPALGTQITWYGYFTEKTFQTTMKALRAAGWKGTDFTELDSFENAGLTNEVELVIEQEPTTDENGNPAGTRARVRWVNAPGSIAVKQRLDPIKAKSLSDRLRGQALAFDQMNKAPLAGGPARSRAPVSSPNPPPHNDSDAPPF